MSRLNFEGIVENQPAVLPSQLKEVYLTQVIVVQQGHIIITYILEYKETVHIYTPPRSYHRATPPTKQSTESYQTVCRSLHI